MITTLRGMRRHLTDLAIWLEVVDYLLDRRCGEWVTLADISPATRASIESVHPLLSEFEREGWVESKVDSGRSMWRATEKLGAGDWGELFRAASKVL